MMIYHKRYWVAIWWFQEFFEYCVLLQLIMYFLGGVNWGLNFFPNLDLLLSTSKNFYPCVLNIHRLWWNYHIILKIWRSKSIIRIVWQLNFVFHKIITSNIVNMTRIHKMIMTLNMQKIIHLDNISQQPNSI